MSDAQRLAIITSAANAIERNYADLQQFNTQNIRLSLQRAKDKNDIERVKNLYGILD